MIRVMNLRGEMDTVLPFPNWKPSLAAKPAQGYEKLEKCERRNSETGGADVIVSDSSKKTEEKTAKF